MTDTRTRELERRARATGDAKDWHAYIEANRLGEEYVRGLCYDLLAENPDGAKRPAIKSLVQRGGIWLDQDEDCIHVNGAQHCGKGDETRQSYQLSWQRERSIWSAEEHASLLPIVRFTYGEIPTLLEIDATVRAIEHARLVGKQPELADTLAELIRADITNGTLTSDRITYQESAIKQLTRAYSRRDQEIIDVNLRSGYGSPAEEMIQALFGLQETRVEIDRRYNAFLGIRHGTWSYFMHVSTMLDYDGPQTSPQEAIFLQIREWGEEPRTRVMSITGVDPGQGTFRLINSQKMQ